MRHIQFVSAWAGAGTETNPHQCAAISLWAANGVRWANLRDMGQPNVMPNPNVCVWEAWVDEKGVTLLEADAANYTILLDEDAGGVKLAAKDTVIGIDKPKDEKPDTTTKTTLETFLKAKGVKDTDAATLCKKSNANATRKDIADAVIAYCNKLPKKK